MALNALRIETIPSDEEIREFYKACAALGPYQQGMYRHPPQVRRMERIKEMLALILPWVRHVLEMGCCDGMLTEWMAPRVKYVLAFDVARGCIERAPAGLHPGVDFVVGNLEEALLFNLDTYDQVADFDIAIATEVLEHCRDPRATVELLGKAAKGILASVPIRERPTPNAFNVEAFSNPKRPGDGTGHIWSFRPDSFKSLFSEIWHYEEIMGCSAIILGR